MSTHVIHRVSGDLAPFLFVELVGTDITGWTIKLLGVYRNINTRIEIGHSIDDASAGQFHFEWGATDLVKGVADFEIDFLPPIGDRFTVPAQNTLLLKVRGKTEPGPGVIAGGETIQIQQDSRTINITGGGAAGINGSIKLGTPTDGTYDDGLFPFTETTQVNDAIDDLNENADKAPIFSTDEPLTIVIDQNEVLGTSVDPPAGSIFKKQAEWDDFLTAQSATGYKNVHLVGQALPHVIAHPVTLNFQAGPNVPSNGLSGTPRPGTDLDKFFMNTGAIIMNGPAPSTWTAIDPSLASLTVDGVQIGSKDPWMDFSTSHPGVFVGLESDIRGSFLVADNGFVGIVVEVVGDRLDLIDVVSPAPTLGVTTVKIARPATSFEPTALDAFSPSITLQLKGNENLSSGAFGSYEVTWFDFPHTISTGAGTISLSRSGRPSIFQCSLTRRGGTSQGPGIVTRTSDAEVDLFQCSLVAAVANGADAAMEITGSAFFARSYAEGWEDGIRQLDDGELRSTHSFYRDVSRPAGPTVAKGGVQVTQGGGLDLFGQASNSDRPNTFADGTLPHVWTQQRGSFDWGGGAEPPHEAVFKNCAESCIAIGSGATIDWKSAAGSGGFSDGGGNLGFGIEFQGSNSHIILSTLDDVSGALGDILMGDGAIVTYAELLAAGKITDSLGNTIEQ